MDALSSDPSRARLDQIVRPGLLCAFDFDGTLAPIVAEPDKARLPAGILRRLVALSNYAPVAIVTGRALDDIRVRLGFEPAFLIGNHGLEGLPGWEQAAERNMQLCREWTRTVAAALQDRGRFDAGIWVEQKRYTLSVHYRQAHDHAKAERQLTDLFTHLVPPAHVIGGKCVFNLLPPDAGSKGTALAQLLAASGARGAVYVGDDVTDEDVFKMRRPDVLSVRIGHAANSAAEIFLPRRCDIVRLLDELLLRLQQAGATNWMSAVPA